jgi:Ca2+-binding EF-hand superfamily protein
MAAQSSSLLDEAAVRQAFSKYDQDGSGKIERAEFRNVLVDLFRGRVSDVVIQGYTEQQFRMADKDLSGSIDFAEFSSFYRSFVAASAATTTGQATLPQQSSTPVPAAAPPPILEPLRAPSKIGMPHKSVSFRDDLPADARAGATIMVRMKTDSGTRVWEIPVSQADTVEQVVARINRDFLEDGEVVDKLFVWDTSGLAEDRRLVRLQYMTANFFTIFGSCGIVITRRPKGTITPSSSDFL